MKRIGKVLLIIPIFMLCGCQSIIDDGKNAVDTTKYALAKSSINKYIENLRSSYQEYQYESSLGTYDSTGGIPVYVNGTEITLRTNYVGEEIICDKTSINNGKVELDNCSVYGYSFDYTNGKLVDKQNN